MFVTSTPSLSHRLFPMVVLSFPEDVRKVLWSRSSRETGGVGWF